MGRPKIYASNADRQRAYRERNHVCHVESILPKRLESALWAFAEYDDTVYADMVAAICAVSPHISAAVKRYEQRRIE
jgi:hypothetical protein